MIRAPFSWLTGEARRLDGQGWETITKERRQLVVYAANERKRCVYEGTGAPTRAGLRTLLRQVGVDTRR